ncbi:Alpha-galactosidase 1 [Canna indica]|uniref:alpha-galactosidase n=1 Tax=Canna indica TaxID=4628 RepID=A0AAQ3KEN8_9LILI|nr:Alpha-galactosidase 1 [Canna indica]
MIKETADEIVSTGLAKLGYQYVNIGIGELLGNEVTFPSGMKALADYVHDKGLKLGMYSSAGYRTCSDQMPGSLGYEYKDAKTFVKWGIDYLKYDNCYNGGDGVRCPNGVTCSEIVGEQPATSWIIGIDPDMLEIGNGGMTNNEYVVHFSLWAIFKITLYLRQITNYQNKLLSIHSILNALGVQGKKVKMDGHLEVVWAGPLCEDRIVVLLLNKNSNESSPITTDWQYLGIDHETLMEVRDLWKDASPDLFKIYLVI